MHFVTITPTSRITEVITEMHSSTEELHSTRKYLIFALKPSILVICHDLMVMKIIITHIISMFEGSHIVSSTGNTVMGLPGLD